MNDKVGAKNLSVIFFLSTLLDIKSMLQDNKKPSVVKSVHLIILTHLAKEKDVLSYFDVVRKERICNFEKPNFIRVLS